MRRSFALAVILTVAVTALSAEDELEISAGGDWKFHGEVDRMSDSMLSIFSVSGTLEPESYLKDAIPKAVVFSLFCKDGKLEYTGFLSPGAALDIEPGHDGQIEIRIRRDKEQQQTRWGRPNRDHDGAFLDKLAAWDAIRGSVMLLKAPLGNGGSMLVSFHTVGLDRDLLEKHCGK